MDNNIKTCEQYVLAEFDKERKRANAFESTITQLQDIFDVSIDPETGGVNIDTKLEAFDPNDPERMRNNISLLVGLFMDRDKIAVVKEEMLKDQDQDQSTKADQEK